MHVDGSVMQYTDVNGQEQTLRSDLSCTVFFAEPEDYEGGELVVADTYGERFTPPKSLVEKAEKGEIFK